MGLKTPRKLVNFNIILDEVMLDLEDVQFVIDGYSDQMEIVSPHGEAMGISKDNLAKLLLDYKNENF